MTPKKVVFDLYRPPSELHQQCLICHVSCFPVRSPYLEKYSNVDCSPLCNSSFSHT